jgi:hypothetical protein
MLSQQGCGSHNQASAGSLTPTTLRAKTKSSESAGPARQGVDRRVTLPIAGMRRMRYLVEVTARRHRAFGKNRGWAQSPYKRAGSHGASFAGAAPWLDSAVQQC